EGAAAVDVGLAVVPDAVGARALAHPVADPHARARLVGIQAVGDGAARAVRLARVGLEARDAAVHAGVVAALHLRGAEGAVALGAVGAVGAVGQAAGAGGSGGPAAARTGRGGSAGGSGGDGASRARGDRARGRAPSPVRSGDEDALRLKGAGTGEGEG